MKNEIVQVRFWTGFNECICFGFRSSIDFESKEEAMDFIEAATIKGAKEITVDTYVGKKCIESLEYNVL